MTSSFEFVVRLVSVVIKLASKTLCYYDTPYSVYSTQAYYPISYGLCAMMTASAMMTSAMMTASAMSPWVASLAPKPLPPLALFLGHSHLQLCS